MYCRDYYKQREHHLFIMTRTPVFVWMPQPMEFPEDIELLIKFFKEHVSYWYCECRYEPTVTIRFNPQGDFAIVIEFENPREALKATKDMTVNLVDKESPFVATMRRNSVVGALMPEVYEELSQAGALFHTPQHPNSTPSSPKGLLARKLLRIKKEEKRLAQELLSIQEADFR